MIVNFSSEIYRQKALQTSKVNLSENTHSVEDAFLLLVKDVDKDNLSNLCLMLKDSLKNLRYPIELSLDECYSLIQGESIAGIELDGTLKTKILNLAYECIESGKKLGEKTINDGKINTSDWMSHCLYEGKIAKELAIKLGVNPDSAQIQGILHDYGRKFTHTFDHVIKGYESLVDEGWEEVAVGSLTHSFLNGGRCASNEQAEPGFYVDEDGDPKWEQNATKDDMTMFLEGYKYNTYDKILNIADLMATSNGIVSPYDRIADIATRRKIDPTNRGYFLAEFTNMLVDALKQMGVAVPDDMSQKIKAKNGISIEEINEKFKTVSDFFYSNYIENVRIIPVTSGSIAIADNSAGLTSSEIVEAEKDITGLNKGEI